MQQHIRGAFEVVRMAVRAQSSSRTTTKRRAVFKIPLHVTRDKQIEPAVAIVVEPAGTRGPTFRNVWKFARDVTESGVAVVAIEIIRFVSTDEQIDVSVVVVVSSSNAHAVSGAFESRAFGHIGERSVGFLLVESVPVFR